MAKAVVVHYRRPLTLDLVDWAHQIDERIRPDNTPKHPPYIYQEDGLFSYVYNATSTVRCHRAGWCLGATAGKVANLFEPLSPKPEGTYALCRADRSYVEVISDYTASRTIWYYRDVDLFVASTSQRLIVSILGDLEQNHEAHAWMLASGTLGPGNSWDRRLVAARPDTTLRLNRETHQLEMTYSSLDFDPVSLPLDEHKQRLQDAVAGAVSSLDLDLRQWALALSGGMDSRSLLYHLPDGADILTVTWGLEKSLSNPHSDAAVARRVAERKNLAHRYFCLDGDKVSFSLMMKRFLKAGEGRIDHISGYNDGLVLWENLSALGRDIIRGYDALGSKWPLASEAQARAQSGFWIASDFENDLIPAQLAVGPENVPPHLRRARSESLEDYRDRLWLEFRTPFVTAALDDIKTSYVEICNPLLFKQVVDVVRALPPKLRMHKVLFDEIVRDMFPDIEFAKDVSTESVDDIVAAPGAREYLSEQLLELRDTDVLPADFLTFLATSEKKISRRATFNRWLVDFGAANLPDFAKRYPLMGLVRNTLDSGRLALRAFIVLDMNRTLLADTKVGRVASR